MTSIIFETATFQDVVAKAARVAPSKAGEAFDKAAGIHISTQRDEVHVRATNLKIYYLEVIDTLSVEGPIEWRLSSTILSGIMSKLKIGTGKSVTLTEKGKNVVLEADRTRAQLRMMNADYFPPWQPFDPNQLELVPNLGARIGQVEWAADTSGEPPLGGVHIDGQRIISTDRYRLACVPCKAEPVYKPITVPSGIFDPVMRTMKDAAIGIDENQLLLMPDHATQIRAAIFDLPYPNLERALRRDHPDRIKCKKQPLLDMIDLAMVFGQKERIPKLSVFLGKSELAVMMVDAEEGLLGDVLDLPGQAGHRRVTIDFTPNNLRSAVDNAPSEEIELFYDKDKPEQQVRVDGGSGYEAWVAPRSQKKE